jgi:hypothetical protein
MKEKKASSDRDKYTIQRMAKGTGTFFALKEYLNKKQGKKVLYVQIRLSSPFSQAVKILVSQA